MPPRVTIRSSTGHTEPSETATTAGVGGAPTTAPSRAHVTIRQATTPPPVPGPPPTAVATTTAPEVTVSTEPSRSSAIARLLTGTLLIFAALAMVTGIISFLGWMIPEAGHGILPPWFVHGPEKLRESLMPGLYWAHVAAGLAMVLVSAVAIFRAATGRDAWQLPRHETATSAFWRWVAGLFAPTPALRRERLHFRDALIYPVHEALLSILIAGITILLSFVPLNTVAGLGLGLHRTNGLYVLFLACYFVMVLALRRRSESPYPKIIRSGRLVVRRIITVEEA